MCILIDRDPGTRKEGNFTITVKRCKSRSRYLTLFIQVSSEWRDSKSDVEDTMVPSRNTQGSSHLLRSPSPLPPPDSTYLSFKMVWGEEVGFVKLKRDNVYSEGKFDYNFRRPLRGLDVFLWSGRLWKDEFHVRGLTVVVVVCPWPIFAS